MANSYLGNMSVQDAMFKHYGVTLTCEGCNGMPPDLFVGIVKNAFSLTTGSELISSPLAKAPGEVVGGIYDSAVDWLSSLLPGNAGALVGGAGKIAKDIADLQNMASTVKQWSVGSGGDSLNINFVYMPGFLGTGSFKDAEDKLSKMTLPKKPANLTSTVAGYFGNMAQGAAALQSPYESYYYEKTSGTLKMLGDSFNDSFINITLGNFFSSGGYYCTSASREYSYEVDDNGKPIYMTISLTLQKWRGLFAEEVPKMFK